jgi:hypothetical protein
MLGQIPLNVVNCVKKTNKHNLVSIKMKLHKLSNVISPAINLWLHSQLDQVQTLDINITGRNRDLLQGYIPQVSLFGSYPVYQGLHLGQVELTGSNIRVNLAQILKGQPLRLLEPVLVKGKVVLEQSHLNLSLASSLLSTALTELVSKFLQTTSDYSQDYWHNLPVNWENIEIKGYYNPCYSTFRLNAS